MTVIYAQAKISCNEKNQEEERDKEEEAGWKEGEDGSYE